MKNIYIRDPAVDVSRQIFYLSFINFFYPLSIDASLLLKREKTKRQLRMIFVSESQYS